MKFFTHYYKIELFLNGKFCWRNHGWIEKGINDYKRDAKQAFCINLLLIFVIFMTD